MRSLTAQVLGEKVGNIKVIPSEIGGGFGGKTTIYLEPLAVRMSQMTGRPVKMTMSREDVFRATGPTSGTWCRAKIGAKQDGTFTAASAWLAYEAGAFPGAPIGPGCMSVLAPYLRVYLDGGLVYRSEKAWNFGVARDGSSFFAVEPLAGQASRLVIRNLDLGVEIHHDLGAEFNPFTEYEGPYGASYTRDAAEVAFWPPQQRDGVLGDYWFYPVGGGDPRVVRAVSAGTGAPRRPGGAADAADPRLVRTEFVARHGNDRLVFDSSEVVYHIADKSPTWRGGGPFEVAKFVYAGYGSTGGPRRTEAWRRSVPMHVATWARAPDGPWLALGDGGRRVLALDTSTGELTLAFLTAGDAARRVPERLRRREVPGAGGMNHVQWAWASATLARLRGVLGPEATVADVGRLGGFWFEDGNRLVLSRSTGSHGDFRRFHDVFDMATVAVDGEPVFRLDKDDVACGLGGLRGLDVRDGRLVYPGPRAVPTSDRAWIEADPVVDGGDTP